MKNRFRLKYYVVIALAVCGGIGISVAGRIRENGKLIPEDLIALVLVFALVFSAVLVLRRVVNRIDE